MFQSKCIFYSNVVFKRLVHSKPPLASVSVELINSTKCFGGEQRFYAHYSDIVKCKMNFGIYLPPKAVEQKLDCPVLYFLEGYKGSHNDFIVKSGFQKFASKFGICVVCPDTSPRNVDIPNHDTLGTEASFYVDATQEPWSKHYQMFTYVTKELIELIGSNFLVIKDWQSISGFSMGGYGALISSLKNPGQYQSVSAFCPACNPIMGGLAKTVLDGYIGTDVDEQKKWDPSELVENYSGNPMEIFIDQGTRDELSYGKHLLPENLVRASAKNNLVKVIFKEREGYNHSHYFVSTFIEEHMEYHAKFLNSI